MAKCVVLWISCKRAIIISTTDGVQEILHVESKDNRGVEGKERQRRGEYYRKVILAIQDALGIFAFGTAQAKLELKGEILKVGTLSHRVLGTELADVMTEDQLVARAREICR